MKKPNDHKSNQFLEVALEQIPRLLGQLNRNPSSLSYGSFDRAYWHYRTNDISCARYQEAVLTLAYLYSNLFEGNIYYKDGNILNYIRAALSFSISIQNKDGSFNEWYLNEGSFVATSFITAALARTLLILDKSDISNYADCILMLKRSADWLRKRDETLVYNQFAGAATASVLVYKLTGDESYKTSAKEKIDTIINKQNDEGWWNEYGGPDIGYLSLMIDYLMKYYEIINDERVVEAVKKAEAFIVNFLHPNFTAGGEYMSRNTEYLIPSGFVFSSRYDPNGLILSNFTVASLELKAGVQPENLDDRYLCYILYNWIEAGLNFNENKPFESTAKYLWFRRMRKFFKESGLFVFQNDKYYFVANLKKGGVFRIYTSVGYTYLDSGIEVASAGKSYISNILNPNSIFFANENSLSTRGTVHMIKEPLMKTSTMIFFKIFQLLFGNIGWIQRLIKKILRKKMIVYQSKQNLRFARLFELKPDSIIVKDLVYGIVPEANVKVGTKSSYTFIPSSKYFTAQELAHGRLEPKEERNYDNKLALLTLNRFWDNM
ncbi:MAG: hypothetical protein US98_C0001G0016 [Parcubacteria group bacterium GW2011_GWC1_38_6]|uniref:Squalene cyclase C-terminal domain-containing protein n=1 Tax=Candidatus Zambryskibacteria bacterium RIFCSPHIGHO2_01_FULL_46_25 TaxID=1802738 RepID=A0A1G2T1N6_9BACT|nr:MAG: hypothetical protein US98_C0001G0016 [Parcubacteria group bacterium GW2011_GWC1_38_6]OHA90541.1 MAG: hypothetical protein A2838_01020 [Candidatus Zambryskibacteria bacterium RIFCSPHIGHO2_01_FULL_46_25]